MNTSELTGPYSDAVATDDSHVTQVIKLVPVTKDTGGSCTDVDMNEHIGPCSSAVVTDDPVRAADGLTSCTLEHDSQDCFVGGKPDSLPDVKEEAADVRHAVMFILK